MFLFRTKKSVFHEMEFLTNKTIVENFKTFSKYAPEIRVKTRGNSFNVQQVVENGVEVETLLPVAVEGCFRGTGKIEKITSITICINTIYNIAKILEKDPLEVLSEVLYKLTNMLEEGFYEEISFEIINCENLSTILN